MKYFLYILLFIASSCNSEGVIIEVPGHQESVEKTAGYNIITFKNSSKCNLTEAYYSLDSNKTDSASIAILSKTLAKDLFVSKRKEENCGYPVMSQVLIYATKEDYQKDESDYISICTITPTNLNGDVFINTIKLKKINKY